MDNSAVEHSDSDSGESWTLLENTPAFGDDAPDFPEIPATENLTDNIEVHSDKDEDTDGISIISDSDPESSLCHCDVSKCLPSDNCLTEQDNVPLLTTSSPNNNQNEASPSIETDYLGDNIKYKTYVHKRNPKVGTILDVIMLGTFVITAGMALGHLWSCKNECTTNNTSVNKILSNLYKLQEENAYLRNKLKEITIATGYQQVEPSKLNDKVNTKQHRCKKIFEEPLIKDKKVEGSVRCVDDNKSEIINKQLIPEHEKEFLNDVDKMKNIYENNKIWLDAEVMKQFKAKLNNGKIQKDSPIEKQLGPIYFPRTKEDPKAVVNTETESTHAIKVHEHFNDHNSVLEPTHTTEVTQHDLDGFSSDNNELKSHRQINLELQMLNQYAPTEDQPDFKDVETKTFADLLKSERPLRRNTKSPKIKDNDKHNNRIKGHNGKRKRKEDDSIINQNYSDDDIKKDDRYTGPKPKPEKKKQDRHKSHKKQKRDNKYEQWEMKGGYLKDYDEFSVASSQDTDISINTPGRKFLNPDFEKYISKFVVAKNNSSDTKQPKITKNSNVKLNVEKRDNKNEKVKKAKVKDSDWYNKRSALRAEARLKLEQELFGENTSNTAGWYFRRMQKREQCRGQKDNSTFKKFSKRKMNFKMKR